MARLRGPDMGARAVYLPSGAPAANRTAVVYSNAAATNLADIRTDDGSNTPGAAISGSVVTVDQYGLLPTFWFPDGVDRLWVKVNNGPAVPVDADNNSRVDAVETRVGELAFNVKAYGAKGDGTTDDTAAILAAVNAANAAGGGTVLFPASTYRINAPLSLPANTRIVGVSGSTIIKPAPGFTGPMVKISYPAGQTFGNRYGHLEGVVIDANNEAGVTVGLDIGLAVHWHFSQVRVVNVSNGIAARLDAAQNSHFEMCQFEGATTMRLANGVGNIAFATCEFRFASSRHLDIRNDPSLPGYALNLFGNPPRTSQNTFTRCVFETNASAAPDYTVYVDDALDNSWVGCVFSATPTAANVYFGSNANRNVLLDPYFPMTSGIPGVINAGFENEIMSASFDAAETSQRLIETQNKTIINGLKSSSSSALIVNTSGSAGSNIQFRPTRFAGSTGERPVYGFNGSRPPFYDTTIKRWVVRDDQNNGKWHTLVVVREESPVWPGATPLRSGLWYSPMGSATTNALTANLEYAVPLFVSQPATLSAIGVNVTAAGAAGTVLRLGIRQDVADNVGGYPGTLLLDAGTVAGDAVAFASLAVSLAVVPGLYWLTCTAQGGSPTVSALNGPNPYVGHASAASVSSRGAYRQSGVTGALPASFSSTVDAQGAGPQVQVKV